MSCSTISLGRRLGAVSGCESSPWESWDHDQTNSDGRSFPKPSSLSHGWPKFNVRKSVVTDPPWLSMKPPSQRCQALMFFVYLFFWIFEPLPISSPVAEAAKKWWWTWEHLLHQWQDTSTHVALPHFQCLISKSTVLSVSVAGLQVLFAVEDHRLSALCNLDECVVAEVHCDVLIVIEHVSCRFPGNLWRTSCRTSLELWLKRSKTHGFL